MMPARPQSTAPTTVSTRHTYQEEEERPTVKFRCERDVLVEALGTAGRAVASRGGALPALSGIRLEVTGDVLHLAGSDLDLTIQAETPVAGLVDGVVVVPARLGIDIVRSLDPGAVTVEGDEDEVRIASGRAPAPPGRGRAGGAPSGRPRRRLRAGPRSPDHPAHRERVPQLPPAHPGQLSQPAQGGPGSPPRRRAPGEAPGQGQHHAGE